MYGHAFGTATLLVLFASGCGHAKTTDVNEPILPGWGQHYWNKTSKWYIHPPAFDFKSVDGAASYRFRVIADGTVTNFFGANDPKSSLKPVWPNLPRKGYVEVCCEGVDAQGLPVGVAGEAKFWKNAPFAEGTYPAAKHAYAESAKRAFDYLFALPAIRTIAETGRPDFAYTLNCYPTKMNAAIIEMAVSAARNDPSRKDEMLKLARAAADYLLTKAEPAGAPLAYFTETYSSESKQFAAVGYQGQVMLDYPCRAAIAFVHLYRFSGEKKYFEAAERIAETYLKTQGEDGTWYLKIWLKDGKPVAPNRLTPVAVSDMFELLYAETGKAAYRTAADRAFAFIEKGPLANWNWEGQFEDVAPTKPYENLTKHTAVDTAIHLLNRYPGDKKRLDQARAIMDYAEDQFIAWEKPCRDDGFSYPSYSEAKLSVTNWWCFPAVMEQYNWYVPTDASTAKMIRGYLALYAADGNPRDLAKARALADAYTHAQRENGRIPTQWMGDWFKVDPQSDWINCMISSANALVEIATATGK